MHQLFRKMVAISLILLLIQAQFLFLNSNPIQAATVTTGITLDKTQVSAGYTSLISINAAASGGPEFEPGVPPVVAILLNDAVVTSVSITQPTASGTTRTATSFKIGTGLVAGNYQIRFLKSDNTTYYANFAVVTPTVSLSTSSIPNTYSSSISLTLTGTNTSFASGQTTVAVLDSGNNNTNKAGTATIASATSLSFTLATGLAAGAYNVKVSTGTETATAVLTVRNPSVTVLPVSAALGYNLPVSVTATGTNTKFTENTPTVAILSGTTVMASPTATVASNTALTFAVPTGLTAGAYTVKISTGQEIVTSTFTVNTATIALTDGGQTLAGIAEGYAAKTITATGTNTSFSSSTTVTLTKAGTSYADKITAITANSATSLTFSLGTGLTAGTYTVTVATNGVSATYGFSVVLPTMVSNASSTYSKDFKSNKSITLTGTNTSFTQNVTTVAIKRSSTSAEIASATSAVSVSSATALTFEIVAGTTGFTADTYKICATTSGVETCASNTFSLTQASVTINPSTILSDIATAKTITVTGSSTNFASGSTTGQLLSGATVVTGVTVSTPVVTSATGLTLTLTKADALTVGTYTLRLTTNSTEVNNEVVDATLTVSNTGINLNESVLQEGYTATSFTVTGTGTSFGSSTTVEYKASTATAYTAISAASITLNGNTSMTVAIPLGLPSKAGSPKTTETYTLKIGSDTTTFTVIPVTAVVITPSAATTLKLTGTVQLTATATYSNGTFLTVTNTSAWASSASAVATVSSAGGLVSGITDGSATISATWAGVAGTKVILVDGTGPVINNAVGTNITFTPTATETGLIVSLKKDNVAVNAYTLGSIIGIEGTYVLEAADAYENKTTKNFIVLNSDLGIAGVDDGKEYNVGVSPTVTGGTATYKLNGGSSTSFNSGNTLSNPGNYVFTVTDSFGNFRSKSFIIKDKVPPTVTGVTNTNYNTAVTPIFSEGTATISKDNGTATVYVSGTSISEAGIYVLTVTNGVGNSTIITFTITLIPLSGGTGNSGNNESVTTITTGTPSPTPASTAGSSTKPSTAPSTTPKPEASVTIDPTLPLTTTQLPGKTIISASGAAVTTLDTAKIVDDVKKSTDNDFKIVVANEVKNVEVFVSTDVFQEIAKKGSSASLTIASKQAEFNIPIQALDLSALRSQLGVSFDQKLDIQISIKEPDAAIQTAIKQKVDEAGSKVIVDSLDFSMEVTSGGKTTAITSFDNVFVTRSFEVKANQVNQNLTTGVLYLPETNQYRPVPTKFTVGNDGKVRIELRRNGNSVYTVLETKASFKDIAADHWANNNIHLMASKLILNGMGENNFVPEGQITRAQFAAIVVRALGLLPQKSTNQFNDVSSTAWYAGEIQAAYSAKIVSGRSNDKFDPDSPVSRQDMALMISNAMTYAGKASRLSQLQETTALSKFSDVSLISSYAQSAVAYAVNQNIVRGMTEKTFVGKGLATRAQASTMVLQMLRALEFVN